MKKDILQGVQCLLLDMDGTLYVGDRLIPGVAETLSAARDKGLRLVYLTNNSSKTEEEYRDKLVRLGLWGAGDTVYTSGMAAADYMKTEHPHKSVYLVGTDSMKAYFASCGITLAGEDGRQPDAVMLAYDPGLTYQKLVYATRYLVKGAFYAATHPDVTCPAPDVNVPDTGSFMALIEACTGRRPSVICGKPYAVMGGCVARLLGLSPRNILMVGDRMSTDMAFALNNGFKSLLVLSGDTSEAAARASEHSYDGIAPTLAALLTFLK